MKKSKTLIALAIAAAGLVAAESALAQHRRHHHHHHHGARVSIGFAFGVPLAAYGYSYFHPPYAYYPRYYPAPVVIQQQPTVYVEQNPAPAPAVPPAPAAYWYFCADSRAYYPYAKECPSGWMRVAPQPG